MTPEQAKATRLEFKTGIVTLTVAKEVLQATYRLDPSKKPRAIDLTSTSGETKGRTYLGIYELDGDALKICFSEYEQDRPREFAAQGKPGIRTLLVLKRQTK